MQERKQTQSRRWKAHLAIERERRGSESRVLSKNFRGSNRARCERVTPNLTCKNLPLNSTLNQHAFNERGALSHLGIQVASTDDVLAVRERWTEVDCSRDEMQNELLLRVAGQDVGERSGRQRVGSVRRARDNLPETAACATSAATCCAPAPIGITQA